jgi:predicted amino acid dehydrogenase
MNAVTLGRLSAVAMGKALNLHLGPLTPLEAAEAYTSTTPLGAQIAALQTLYANLGSLAGGTVSQNLTVLGSQTALGNVLVALVAIDQAQIKAAASGSSGSDAATAAAGGPGDVSPIAAGLLATGAAAAGGILGWVARGEFGSAGKRK